MDFVQKKSIVVHHSSNKKVKKQDGLVWKAVSFAKKGLEYIFQKISKSKQLIL